LGKQPNTAFVIEEQSGNGQMEPVCTGGKKKNSFTTTTRVRLKKTIGNEVQIHFGAALYTRNVRKGEEKHKVGLGGTK